MCAVLLAVLLYFGIVRGVRALPLWGGVAGLALVFTSGCTSPGTPYAYLDVKLASGMTASPPRSALILLIGLLLAADVAALVRHDRPRPHTEQRRRIDRDQPHRLVRLQGDRVEELGLVGGDRHRAGGAAGGVGLAQHRVALAD